MTATTSSTATMRAAITVAVVAEVLDLGVDHETDLTALVADMEADGYTVTDDPDAATIDEMLTRVAAYSTAPIPY